MTRQVRDPKTGWWYNVPEPRKVTLATAVAYLMFSAAGFSAMIDHPDVLLHGLGEGWILYWNYLMAFGGLTGCVAALKGTYWLERIAVIAAVTGLALYLGSIMDQHEIPGHNRLPSMFLYITLIGAAIGRLGRIMHGRKNPEIKSTYHPKLPKR